MGAVEDRLATLGRTVPEVAAPVAAYVPAVRSGAHVFTSGQLPTVSGSLMGTGRVGVEVSPEDAREMAAQCALNAVAAVRSVIGDLDRVTRVVKVVGYVACEPGFAGQPAVINGASDLLREAFGEAGAHARSAVGVAALPLGAPVELDLVVEVV